MSRDVFSQKKTNYQIRLDHFSNAQFSQFQENKKLYIQIYI
jgi:hypothetical protein